MNTPTLTPRTCGELSVDECNARTVALTAERDQLRVELAAERARLDYVLKITGWYFGKRSELDGFLKGAAT